MLAGGRCSRKTETTWHHKPLNDCLGRAGFPPMQDLKSNSDNSAWEVTQETSPLDSEGGQYIHLVHLNQRAAQLVKPQNRKRI